MVIRFISCFYLISLLVSCSNYSFEEIHGHWYSTGKSPHVIRIDENGIFDYSGLPMNNTLIFIKQVDSTYYFKFEDKFRDAEKTFKLVRTETDQLLIYNSNDSLLGQYNLSHSKNVLEDLYPSIKTIELPKSEGVREQYGFESGLLYPNMIVIFNDDGNTRVVYNNYSYDLDSIPIDSLMSKYFTISNHPIYISADKKVSRIHIHKLLKILYVAERYNVRYILNSDSYDSITFLYGRYISPTTEEEYDSLSNVYLLPPPPFFFSFELLDKHGLILNKNIDITKVDFQKYTNVYIGIPSDSINYAEYIHTKSLIFQKEKQLEDYYSLELYGKNFNDTSLNYEQVDEIKSKARLKIIEFSEKEFNDYRKRVSFKEKNKTLISWLNYHQIENFHYKNPITNSIALNGANAPSDRPEILPDEFQSFWIYSPDSAWFIDMDSYNSVIEFDGERILHLGRDVDTKIILSLGNRKNWELLFCGTTCIIEAAYWDSNRQFTILGFSETNSGEYVPTKWSSEYPFDHIDITYSTDTLDSWRNGYVENYRLKHVVFAN